jgi:hypothetical protein
MTFRSTTFIVLTAVLAGFVSGCAEIDELMFSDNDPRTAAEIAHAQKESLWEIQLMAGRYGVMLGQAREILGLPEPEPGEMFPGDSEDVRKQQQELAAYQARVTNEFLTDAATACKRKRVPSGVRKMACEQQKKTPADLRQPTNPDLVALSQRNERVGEVIMPWWDAVCATKRKGKAPKPDDEPICPME